MSDQMPSPAAGASPFERGGRRSRRALVSVPVAAVATLTLVLGAPGAANANDGSGGLLDHVGTVVKESVKPVDRTVHKALTPRSGGSSGSSSSSGGPVRDTVRKVTGTLKSSGTSSSRSTSSSSSTDSSSAPSSSSSSRSTGSTTRRSAPKAAARPAAAKTATASTPNAATGTVGHLDLSGYDLLDLSRSSASGSGADAGSSATLVGLAGRPLIGSSAATSGGSAQGSGPVPGNLLCAPTGGAACVDAAYADSTARAGGGASSSTGRTGLLEACLLGDDPTGSACRGVSLGLDQSQAEQRTDATGSTSRSSSSLADLCVPGGPGGDCALSLDALQSSSSAGAGATPEDAPQLLDLGVLGSHLGLPREAIDVQAPRGCTQPSLVCAVLNQQRPDGAAAASGGLLGTLVGAALSDSSATSSSPTPGTGGAGGAPVAGPDYALAHLADVNLAGQDVLGLSRNKSTGTAQRTQGDASLISLLGRDLIGAHADSDGKTSDGGPLLELPTCVGTSAGACADLLYAEAHASRTATTRDSSTRTGVADACLLGTSTVGACNGLVLGLAQGSSSLHSDSTTGTSTASASSSAANTCLTASGGCLVSGDLLTASATSDNKGHTSSSSSLADLTVDGTTIGLPANPITLTIPTGGVIPTLATLALNQSSLGLAPGASSVTTTVVGVTGLGGLAGVDVSTVGTSTSDANVVRPPTTDPSKGNPPTTGNPPTAGNQPSAGTSTQVGTRTVAAAEAGAKAPARAAADGGALPDTGGTPLALLTWGLVLLAAGLVILAARRRTTGWL